MIAEILAPVGSLEMLRPAVFCGANAVYLGMQAMNARRSAKGFSESELIEAVAFCHARGVRVYVALNTVIYKNELSAVCDAIHAICSAGADAIIVQDLATAFIAQSIAPSLSLHASTQMSVHSLSGAIALQKAGFSRVILSRELSLSEIEYITKNCTIDTEVFVHGALCMSVSGQCYMSAFLGGRSGNRGSCAGPCRLPFSASEAGNCHLSLKDMSHIEHLPRLAEIGVKSFKIEGRLRSEEYVAAAVNACVCALAGDKYDTQILQDVFSRSGFTDGYIKGKRDGEMFGVRTEGDSAAARLAEPRLRELYRRERQATGASISLEVKNNELIVSATSGGCIGVSTASFEPQEAKTDTRDALIKALSKCGGTPFFAKAVNLSGGEGVFIPQGIVSELRREALCELLEKLQAVAHITTQPYALPRFERLEHSKKGIIARFESYEQIPSSLNNINRIIVSIFDWRRVATALRAKTWLELPRTMFGSLEQEVIELIKLVENEGFAGFTAENIAHFELLRGKKIMGGFGLNVANPIAAQAYHTLGAELITVSCELLAAETPYFSGETAAIAYAHMPLMLTRACPLRNTRSCAACPKKGTLLDRKNVRFPLLCKHDMRTIYNPIPLYMGERRGELCTDYDILYFTIESAENTARIIDKFLDGSAFEGEFTRGLYYKGTT